MKILILLIRYYVIGMTAALERMSLGVTLMTTTSSSSGKVISYHERTAKLDTFKTEIAGLDQVHSLGLFVCLFLTGA